MGLESGAGDPLIAVLRIIAVVIGVSLTLSATLFFLSLRKLKHVEVREGAGAFETLRAIPFSVALGLDLLDLSLDVFAAPVSWWILRRYRLMGLRDVAVIEALIPGTQLLPLISCAWLFARVAPPGFEQAGPNIIEVEARTARASGLPQPMEERDPR